MFRKYVTIVLNKRYENPVSLVKHMMSSNGNIFRVTGPLRGNPPIALKKGSDSELWYFLWSTPEQTRRQTIDKPVIWDAMAIIMTSQ